MSTSIDGNTTNGGASTGGPSTDAAHVAPPAQPWRLVARREIVVKLTDRNFLLSTGLTLLLLIGSFAFSAVMSARESPATKVVTTQPAAADVVKSLADGWTLSSGDVGNDPARLEAVTAADAAAARAAVASGDADAYLYTTAAGSGSGSGSTGGWVLATGDNPDLSLQATLASQIQIRAVAANAAAAGTTVDALMKGSQLATERVASDGSDGDTASNGMPREVVYIVSFIMAMLFYMASLMFGMGIATSVVEEKQSRIVEILATMIPMRQLLLGKVIGNTALALGQMVLFAIVGLIGVRYTGASQYLGMITAPVGWFLVFFLAGFLALACIWAAAGSLASRSEDLQSTTMPLTMMLIAALFVGLRAEGTGRVIASYVPVVSTVVMPVRLFDGTARWWEALIALALTVAFAGATVLFGERLYRRSVLQTGGRVGVRQALRTQD